MAPPSLRSRAKVITPEKIKEPKKPEEKEKKKISPDNGEKKVTPEKSVERMKFEQDDATAKVVVTLPADAKLYFNNVVTRSKTGRREFQSPALNPGMIYEYNLKAEVVIDGKTKVKTAVVEVRAGQVVQFDFVFPAGLAAR